MKIISKFKDFYDYKVTKYGVDEKLIYTRKTYCEYFQVLIGNIKNINIDYRISEDNFNKNFKDDTKIIDEKNIHKILVLGEKLVHLFFTENGVYTHFDAKKLEVSKGIYQYYYSKEITFNDGRNFEIYTDFGYAWDKLFSYDRKKFFSSMKIDKSDIIFNEPMLLIEYFGESYGKNLKYHSSVYKFTYNPNLSQIGVYIDEDFIWQSLVEFLSNKRSEKEISPEVSNENKILSKGFDLKTSFRPNMKKKHKVDI